MRPSGVLPAKPAALSLSDVLGLGRLAADGAAGLTELVEHMHASSLDTPGLAPLALSRRSGLAAFSVAG